MSSSDQYSKTTVPSTRDSEYECDSAPIMTMPLPFPDEFGGGMSRQFMSPINGSEEGDLLSKGAKKAGGSIPVEFSVASQPLLLKYVASSSECEVAEDALAFVTKNKSSGPTDLQCKPPLGHEDAKETNRIIPRQHVKEIDLVADMVDLIGNEPRLSSFQPGDPSRISYMSEKSEQSECRKDFLALFQEYREKRRHLSQLFHCCINQCNHLDSTILEAERLPHTPGSGLDTRQLSSEWMAKEEQEAIETILVKNPVLVFFGQTNSGKSSIINQLLGTNILEVAENPCQVGLIRLKFSQHNYFTIKDSNTHEEKLKEPLPMKVENEDELDKVLGQLVAKVKDSDLYKSQCEDLQCYIEIGLKNPFLAAGVELIDTPGIGQMSHSKSDKLIKLAAGSLLQSVVYVIDSNRSISETDRGFLYRLRSTLPWVNVYYIVNKIDYDKQSVVMDMETDDESDATQLGEQIKVEKLSRVYNNLLRNDLLPAGVDMEDSRYFCGLSMVEVSEELKRGFDEDEPSSMVPGESVQQFLKMQKSFMNLGTKVLEQMFRRAVSTLYLVQKRLFDLFTEDNKANRQMQAGFEKSVKTKFEELRNKAASSEKQFCDIFSDSLLAHQDDIIETASKMRFRPLKIGDYVRRNEMAIQCRDQIQDFVLCRVNTLVENHFSEVKQFKKKIFKELSKIMEELVNSMPQQFTELEECISFEMKTEMNAVYDYIMDSSVIMGKFNWKKLRVWGDKIQSMFGDTKTQIDVDWKKKIAESFVSEIDPSIVAAKVFETVQQVLQSSEERLRIYIRSKRRLLRYLSRDHGAFRNREDSLRVDVLYNMLRCEALYTCAISARNTDKNGEMSDTIDRLEVQGDETEIRFISDDEAKKNSLYLLAHRLLPPKSYWMLPSSITLIPPALQLHIITPKIDTNLLIQLRNETPPVWDTTQALGMLYNIAKACSSLRALTRNMKQEIVPDLRPENILLNYSGNEVKASLNITRAPALSRPYNNITPVFHWCPYVSNGKESPSTSEPHLVWQLAVLAWLLDVKTLVAPPATITHDGFSYSSLQKAMHQHGRGSRCLVQHAFYIVRWFTNFEEVRLPEILSFTNQS